MGLVGLKPSIPIPERLKLIDSKTRGVAFCNAAAIVPSIGYVSSFFRVVVIPRKMAMASLLDPKTSKPKGSM